MAEKEDYQDVVIIGGGIAGLTTAALLARAGKTVTVFEQSSREIGGRARTSIDNGYYFNQGPHALFLADEGAQVLKDLGVTYTGGEPPATGMGIRKDAKGHRLLTNSNSQSLIPVNDFNSDEVYAKFSDLISKANFAELENVTVTEWINRNFQDADAIAFLKAIISLTTYGNDPDTQSAGSALHQAHLYNLGGVMYLDRGWQTIVDGIAAVAKNAKAKIIMGKKATKVQRDSSGGWIVTLSDKSQIPAKILVIAVGPNESLSLFRDGGEPPEALSIAVKETRPVHLACLDVALSSLPQKDALFALGIDSPLYFSVHSPYAELAPPGGALVHVAKYLGSSIKPNPREDEKELEELLDLMQPGWREVVVKKRPLPSMVLSNALVTAANGGLSGRVGPKIEEGLYIVGDWVGNDGLISSGSFASARRAAHLILEGPARSSGDKPSISESIPS